MANYTLSPSPFLKFFLADGVTPNANGRVFTYAAGLTSTATTYQNSSGTVNSNPIHLDGSGQCEIFLAPGSYAYAVYAAPLIAGLDTSGGLIETQDNILAVPVGSVNTLVPGIAGETLLDGQTCYVSDGSGSKTAGRWYLAKADNAYSSTTPELGVCIGGAATGASGQFLVGGQVTSGISPTVGLFQYIDASTAGALTATAPTLARIVGFADSGSSIIFFPQPAATLDNAVCDGRLTLTTAVPVTTADVTAATAVYFTPYKGNRIALYDGTRWNIRTFSELSIALGTDTIALGYDVFAYDNSGVVAIERLAWTSATARATALTTQDGVLVKTGATTRRFLGSYYTTAAGQTESSVGIRAIRNYYNRVVLPMRVLEATNTWSYTTATWRQANAAAGNKLQIFQPWPEDPITVRVQVQVVTTAAVSVSIGEDSVTAPTTGAIYSSIFGNATSNYVLGIASLQKVPSVGYHYYAWLEIGGGAGATTWYGDDGGTLVQSGIYGEIPG